MKKLKMLGAISFALIGGGALCSVPFISTSCSNASISISPTSTSCQYSEYISVRATVKHINTPLKWYVDGTAVDELNNQLAIYSQSGLVDNNIELTIVNHNNQPNRIFNIDKLYAQSNDGKYTSNKINLSLNSIPNDFTETIRVIANKRSIRYHETAIITAWTFSAADIDSSTITFYTRSSNPNFTDTNWEETRSTDSAGINAQQEIYSKNVSGYSFSTQTYASCSIGTISDSNISEVTLLPVYITVGTSISVLKYGDSYTWHFGISDSNFVIEDFEYPDLNPDDTTYQYTISGDNDEILTIRNTNYMILNGYDLYFTISATSNDGSVLTTMIGFDMQSI